MRAERQRQCDGTDSPIRLTSSHSLTTTTIFVLDIENLYLASQPLVITWGVSVLNRSSQYFEPSTRTPT